jgi:hypothetical protein
MITTGTSGNNLSHITSSKPNAVTELLKCLNVPGSTPGSETNNSVYSSTKIQYLNSTLKSFLIHYSQSSYHKALYNLCSSEGVMKIVVPVLTPGSPNWMIVKVEVHIFKLVPGAKVASSFSVVKLHEVTDLIQTPCCYYPGNSTMKI